MPEQRLRNADAVSAVQPPSKAAVVTAGQVRRCSQGLALSPGFVGWSCRMAPRLPMWMSVSLHALVCCYRVCCCYCCCCCFKRLRLLLLLLPLSSSPLAMLLTGSG